mmetsp:Transcript_82995/g.201149  ORF Transcript_82995/g.201149 Transcript_82995/m.201149 type:complete len:263 (-) Transcript_82995:2915-3703(-)
MAEPRVSLADLADDLVLQNPPLHTPEEEAPSTLPLQTALDDSHCLHAAGAVVQVSKVLRDGCVQWQQLPLPSLDSLLELFLLVTGGMAELPVKVPELLVILVHCLHLLGTAVLYLYDPWWLEDPATGLHICIHLHFVWVDLRVDHHPSASPEFAVRRYVYKDGMLVIDECVDYLCAILENLAVHVSSAPGKATPIGKNHDRKILPAIEVAKGLRSLEGTVWKPDLASLGLDNFRALWVGRVRRHHALHTTRLHSNHSHWDTA